MRLGAGEKAETVLRENLKQSYCAQLIRLYGKVLGADLKKQLLFAQSLLNKHSNDPELFLALGRLAARNELWGKAREYFENSLRIHKTVDGYNELGHLLVHLDDFETSATLFSRRVVVICRSCNRFT